MLQLDISQETYYSTGIDPERTNIDFNKSMDAKSMLCQICQKILVDPKTCSECFQSFCTPCVKALIEFGEMNGQCLCKKKFVPAKLANKPLMRSLSNIMVKCRFAEEGCEVKSHYENLFEHEAICDQRKALCIYLDCPEVLKINELRAHEKKCMYKIVKCSFCTGNFKLGEIKIHESKCDKRQRLCPGCKTLIINPQYDYHLENCFKKLEPCIRCGERLNKKDLTSHRKMDCLRIYFDRLKMSYNNQIKMMTDTINDINGKLSKMDEFMIFHCRGCNRFGNESILKECECCKDNYYCNECERNYIKRCTKCNKNFCAVCAKFCELDKLCTFCDKQNKDGTNRPRPPPGKKWTAKRTVLSNIDEFRK